MERGGWTGWAGPDWDEAETPLAASPCSWELWRVLDRGRGLVKLAIEEISLSTVNGGVGWRNIGGLEVM